MVSFQVIFTGNEDELYRFVITWKMMAETKRYEEMKRQVEELEKRMKELRKELRRLEDRRRKLQEEINELASLKETFKRDLELGPEAVSKL